MEMASVVTRGQAEASNHQTNSAELRGGVRSFNRGSSPGMCLSTDQYNVAAGCFNRKSAAGAQGQNVLFMSYYKHEFESKSNAVISKTVP